MAWSCTQLPLVRYSHACGVERHTEGLMLGNLRKPHYARTPSTSQHRHHWQQKRTSSSQRGLHPFLTTDSSAVWRMTLHLANCKCKMHPTRSRTCHARFSELPLTVSAPPPMRSQCRTSAHGLCLTSGNDMSMPCMTLLHKLCIVH